MPYIKQEDRRKFDHGYDFEPMLELCGMACDNPGDLNYAISMLCKSYIQHKGENYQHYNDILGALEGAKLELNRRHIAPYEDIKIKENGDL
jgi:hypothetical protein